MLLTSRPQLHGVLCFTFHTDLYGHIAQVFGVGYLSYHIFSGDFMATAGGTSFIQPSRQLVET